MTAPATATAPAPATATVSATAPGERRSIGGGQRPLFSARAAAGSGPATVEGEVARITFENEETGFRVLRVEVDAGAPPEVWVGVFPPALPGTRVRATGRYERDPKHGEQLRVDTLLTVAPATLEGLERYLGSGMVPGIGPAFAKRIVETFGMETLEVLDRAPERLAAVPGLGDRRAQAVAKAWAAQRAIGAIMIFLQAHGASPALAARIFKRFGPQAIDIVSRSPYRLALDVWGIGFKTADRIARSIGVRADSPERAQAGVLQTLVDLSTRGHVYAPRPELAELAAAMLERDAAEADAAVDALAAAGHVRIEALSTGEIAVYPREMHEAEVRLARRLRALLAGGGASPDRGDHLAAAVSSAIAAFEARARVALAPAQREAIELAARHKVLVITGGPGVGKTTIVRAILAALDRARISVRLAAPTGRAAKRMREATGRAAVTLHRLLEFDPKQRRFGRQRSKPVEARAIIVDEASMLDLSLADALLQATADEARLILVGDVDQLPSVGPGAVLRDVIASGEVPTARLTQIFRQAEGSLIVQNAHRIHDGEPPEGARGPNSEFYVIERTAADAAADLILQLVTERIPRGFGLDPRRDVQVLTPMHKGEAGAIALNARLQAALNPEGPSVTRGARTLRVGDKVMQLRNDYDREVYNGDIGFVSAVVPDERKLTVRFDDRQVDYEEGELDELTLAYATSIHKSQGSEYPAVIVPILTQHFVMLSRNLIYTAVTRGKRLVVLVADPRAVSLALAETRKEDRRTHLAARLREGVAGLGPPC
ncbi:MAG: ATP-dependent RecD-like DNA helicase [Polyangiaceae bacterium]|nr:ATP-dependent RecD-like DNA helicase [Polyangiaceae bacterium]